MSCAKRILALFMASKWKRHIFFFFFFFNIKTLVSFAARRSQGQLNIPSLEKPFMYKSLRKLGGKIKLPVGKYKVTLPMCCLCSLPEEERNINYSNENLDMEK